MNQNKLKLSELNNLVKKAIDASFTAPVWVIGEIAEIKMNRSGHCYLLLVEKDEKGDALIAQARATIWSNTYRMLRPYFETSTGQTLAEGLKIMVSVSVEFHELYGFSLSIRDIDPTYSIGDLARRRKEIITKLRAEGVAEMNRELPLNPVPQKIAIISSPTAAGLEDFVHQLSDNDYHYRFYYKLFPSIMQGNQAESSIINALEQIYPYEGFFDAVVIIRGGGSQADLSCFDNYNLAYHITQFPIPVITGIGHEKDDSIVDLVAHTRLKTPTAVASFLIGEANRFEKRLDSLRDNFFGLLDELLTDHKNRLEQVTRFIPSLVRERVNREGSNLSKNVLKMNHAVMQFLQHENHVLNQYQNQIKPSTRQYLQSGTRYLERTVSKLESTIQIDLAKRYQYMDRLYEKIYSRSENLIRIQHHKLELFSQQASLLDPVWVLKRGYSITTIHGKVLKSIAQVKKGECIETRLADGNIISTVQEEDYPNSGRLKT